MKGSHKGPGLVGCTQLSQPEIHAGIKSFTSEDCSIPTHIHIPSFFSVVKYKPHDLPLYCFSCWAKDDHFSHSCHDGCREDAVFGPSDVTFDDRHGCVFPSLKIEDGCRPTGARSERRDDRGRGEKERPIGFLVQLGCGGVRDFRFRHVGDRSLTDEERADPAARANVQAGARPWLFVIVRPRVSSYE